MPPKSGFEMCFAPSTRPVGAAGPNQNTSRIQNEKVNTGLILFFQGAALNCSSVLHGTCLSGVHPLKTLNGVTDLGACCAACEALEACVMWTVNTRTGNCYLRGVLCVV